MVIGAIGAATPPPSPRHLVAQQLLALCLQESQVGKNTWTEWFSGLPLLDDTAPTIAEHLVESGHLAEDTEMLFVGPEAERRYGRKNFMELLSVFTANPEFVVLHGRLELGSVDPMVLTRRIEGPRVVVLAGRSWKVTYIDWRRHRCFVEPTEARASMRWMGLPQPLSFALCRAQRDVLLGAQPAVTVSKRALAGVATLHDERSPLVAHGKTVVRRDGDVWWWTWAGARANATLAGALPDVVDPELRYDNFRIRLRADAAPDAAWTVVAKDRTLEDVAPDVDDGATRGLKFSEILPAQLARRTVSDRLADRTSAAVVLAEPRRWLSY